MEIHTITLIFKSLDLSRERYPNNYCLLDALKGEVSELEEALNQPIEPELYNKNPYENAARIEEEAADCIAILIRIMEEGDASFHKHLANEKLNTLAALRMKMKSLEKEEEAL